MPRLCPHLLSGESILTVGLRQMYGKLDSQGSASGLICTSVKSIDDVSKALLNYVSSEVLLDQCQLAAPRIEPLPGNSIVAPEALEDPNCTQCANRLSWTDGGDVCDDEHICSMCEVRCSRSDYWWFCKHCQIDVCAACAEENYESVAMPMTQSAEVSTCMLPHYSLLAQITSPCFRERHLDPHSTIIILDWDDTLLPTSAIKHTHALRLDAPAPDGILAKELDDVASHVVAVLTLAQTLARGVVIVTNGTEGWVQASCKAWLPRSQNAIQNIPIYSARTKWETQDCSAPSCWKEKEFKARLDEFYLNEAWGNAIAIGDSPDEHNALKHAVLENSSRETCRTKSIRFTSKPSIDELKVQLQILHQNLENVVAYDGNLDAPILQYSRQ